MQHDNNITFETIYISLWKWKMSQKFLKCFKMIFRALVTFWRAYIDVLEMFENNNIVGKSRKSECCQHIVVEPQSSKGCKYFVVRSMTSELCQQIVVEPESLKYCKHIVVRSLASELCQQIVVRSLATELCQHIVVWVILTRML